jgi:hypothetical protein
MENEASFAVEELIDSGVHLILRTFSLIDASEQKNQKVSKNIQNMKKKN